ncbi:hypothetical protein Vafri_1399 [Volvox africanus]|nr:hypothetical protein Vafri_1399 [Volvox africanus]
MVPFVMARYDSNDPSIHFRSSEAGLALVRSSLGLSYAFVLQQYLRSLLQNGSMVVLVTAEQSLERYQYALKKTGFNLQPFQQSGHLIVVEPPLVPLGELVTSSNRSQFAASNAACAGGETARRAHAAGAAVSSGPDRAAALPASGGVFTSNLADNNGNNSRSSGRRTREGAGGCSTLQQLYCAVCRAVECPPPAATAIAVIFDSLTALASLREDEQDWTAFLHYCCSVAAAAPSARHGFQQQAVHRVIVGAYDDVPDDRHWLASLEHRANVVVSVEHLPGRIADVDGIVTIMQRFVVNSVDSSGGPWDAASLAPWRKSLYFKASELAVRWMDRVTARELL